MDKQQCAEAIVAAFPECGSALREHLADYGEILLHVFCAETIGQPLCGLLQTELDRERIGRFCAFIERMWRDGTDEVVNVVDVTILESLSDEPAIWQTFGAYISDEFRTYIDQEVLPHNLMMSGVAVL